MAGDGTGSAPATRPPRGYSWQPFQPGHELTLKHGAFSPRRVDPIAAGLVDQVLADPQCSDLESPRWRAALWAWARAEAQVQLLDAWLAKAGEQSGDGVGDLDAEAVRSAYLLLHRAETRATTQRGRLGLDPLSAARLGRDRAAASVDLAKLMDELRRRDENAGGLEEGSGSDGVDT